MRMLSFSPPPTCCACPARPAPAEFLDVFYDQFLGKLLDVLVQDKGINPRDGTRMVPAATVGLVVDLMCFLVLHHSFRCKYWALRNQLVPKVRAAARLSKEQAEHGCVSVAAHVCIRELVCMCACARRRHGCVCCARHVGCVHFVELHA